MDHLHDDYPELPDFLRRQPMTEQQRKRLDRIVGDFTRRKIKNPPKRVRKSTKLLGYSPVGRKK